MTSTCVADLYRRRGQVEAFFKWLKQHLKIKHFGGNTENAVRIQVAAAISTYCLVAMAREKLKAKQSTYELLQILSASLLDKTPLPALLEKALPETKEEAGTPFLPGYFD